jgi:hypothetical protein
MKERFERVVCDFCKKKKETSLESFAGRVLDKPWIRLFYAKSEHDLCSPTCLHGFIHLKEDKDL